MAKKNTTIFLNNISLCNNNSDLTLNYSFTNIDGEREVYEIIAKTDLSIEEIGLFVDRVVNACFDENGEYRPEYKDVIFQITVLQMLTNIGVYSKKVNELDSEEKPTGKKISIIDVEKTYALCKELDLYKLFIEQKKTWELYETLARLVDEKLAFQKERILYGEKQKLENVKKEFEAGIELINVIGDSLNKSLMENMQNLEGIDELSKKLNELTNMQVLQRA